MDDYPNLEQLEVERKQTLARLLSSIEGIDDEGLHAMFVSRAIKKAVWDEQDLRTAIKAAEREKGWDTSGERGYSIGEEIEFDKLFVRFSEKPCSD